MIPLLSALASLKAGVAVASLATFALVGAGLATPPVTSLATVTMVEGEVRVRSANGADVLAHEGRVLYARDELTTGPSGFAVITYADGSTVALEPVSAVTVEAVQTNTAGRVLILMAQTAGRAWYTIASALSPNSRFEVRTPATAAVVRAGSTVQVEVDAVRGTGITTLSGAAEANAGGTAVGVAAGHSTVVPPGSTPAPPAAIAATVAQPLHRTVASDPVTPSPTPAPVLPKLALPNLPVAQVLRQPRDRSRDDDDERFASREDDEDDSAAVRDGSDGSRDDDSDSEDSRDEDSDSDD